ncbi:AHH domain-containing protein [Pontibacter beigongshangensis]|uniref:AHH domain-containing protein n=1 Tax=Pontibacter beigongshangensis TaxID=2574733 RepID=UPI001650A743|nr:AHH domain-containing protein [Pontibacter beigongshangensis]
MEKNLLVREVIALNPGASATSKFSGIHDIESETKDYATGKSSGFLKEKSFLRKSDLKTKQTYNGAPLFYPDKQMVDILEEKDGWLLVQGRANYQKNGIEHVYTKGMGPVNLKGWVQEAWVAKKQSQPAPARKPTDDHVGKVMEVKGLVKAPLGIKLHAAPNPATKFKSSAIYPKNSEVLIIGLPAIYDDQDWYKIRTSDGKEGWIESRYIIQLSNRYFDLLTEEYYITTAGDKLERLVKSKYKDYNIDTGDDLRTIVHAFSILNDHNPAIYYRGESDSWWRDKVFDRDMAATRKIYASIRLRKGGLIYFPTNAYINYLKDTGKVGQRAGWKNHAIDFGKAILNFTEGFMEGCKRVLENAWEDIKSLFSISFFKDIYNLIRDIVKSPSVFLDSIKDVIGEFFDEVKGYVNSSSIQTKFRGVGLAAGLITGMVVQNTISPGSRLVSLAKLHRLRGISKIIKRVETLSPTDPKYMKATESLKRKIANKRIFDIKIVKRWGAKNAVKIQEAIEKRWTLRKAMGLTDHRQAHHLIPIESLKVSEVVQKAVVEGGFDINSLINGKALKTQLHSTAHDYYNRLIKEQLEAWAKKNGNKFTGMDARKYLENDLSKWAARQFEELKELRPYAL